MILALILAASAALAADSGELTCTAEQHGTYSLRVGGAKWGFQPSIEGKAITLRKAGLLKNSGAVSTDSLRGFETRDSAGRPASIVIRKQDCLGPGEDPPKPFAWSMSYRGTLYSGCCR